MTILPFGKFFSLIFRIFFAILMRNSRDLRKPKKPMMVFEDSHSQDVTQVRFSKTSSNLFCSGSVDGLICVFDISNANEDDAIQNILPVDDSISKIGFYGNNLIHCCTTTEQLSLWSYDEAEVPYFPPLIAFLSTKILP